MACQPWGQPPSCQPRCGPLYQCPQYQCLQPSPLPPSLPTPVTFQASLATATALAATSATPVLFASVTTAPTPGTAYNAGAGSFVAPRAGNYLFTTSLTWFSATAGTQLSVAILKNGLPALQATGTQSGTGSTTNLSNSQVTGILTLALGDIVSVQATADAASTVLNVAGPSTPAVSFFSGTSC